MRVRLSRYLPILLILIFAAYLRTAYIGEQSFSGDGAVHMLKALAMARDGVFPLIGTPMSTGLWHSPMPIWLYAIPSVFTTDPRLARLFTVMMNLFALCLVYRIAHRYFNPRTAVLAAFLYAMHPVAITAAYPIWNPNLGAPFVFGYLLTGLLGYYENKSWARLLHATLLFIAGQMHPTGFLIAPVTLVLMIYAWVAFPASRRAMIVQTFASGILALLLLAPWIIGLARYVTDTGVSAQDQIDALPNRGWAYLIDTVIDNLGGYYDHPYKPVLPLITLIGAGVMLFRLRRRSGFPALPVLMVYALMPILAWVINLPYRDYHHRSCFPAVFIVMAVAVDWLMGLIRIPDATRVPKREALTRVVQWGITSLLLGYLTYNYINFQWIYDVKLNEKGLPLRIQVAAVTHAAGLSVQEHKPLIIFVPTDGEPAWEWEVMRRLATDEGADVLTVWGKAGVPLPQTGAVLIGPTTYNDNPLLFTDAQSEQWAGVRITELGNYPIEWPVANLTTLANGAMILGVLREDRGSMPQAGTEWVVHVLWLAESAPTEEQTMYVHLVDAAGNKYAQSDNPALPLSEWGTGEMVINRFVLPVSPDLPADGALYLRYGMYGATTSTDAAEMQIRASGAPLASFDAWELDAFSTNAPLAQGQPLEVKSAWHSTSNANALSMNWVLRGAADKIVFEESTTLQPDTIRPDMFVPHSAFLRLPTDLPAGTYDLAVSVGDASYHREIEITEMRARSFDAPQDVPPINAKFDDNISLYSADVQYGDSLMTVRLDWFVRERVEGNYNFFVHVLDANGQLVAQHDGVPIVGIGAMYPTFWWTAGEYIRHYVTLDLSALEAGQYTIRVGWYDLLTGVRLPLLDAGSLDQTDDALILDVIDID